MKIRRLKNIGYFFLLLAFFLPPFAFRAIDLRWEIFPSIILPSYASLSNTDKEEVRVVSQLLAYNDNQELEAIPKTDFFHKIPRQYHNYIIGNNFGLQMSPNVNLKTRRFNFKFTQESKVSKKEIADTKVWIRDRLSEMGLKDSILIIRKQKVIINPDRSLQTKKEIINDAYFRLY